MTYTKILHDVATGEITEIELTANEIKDLQKKQTLAEAETETRKAEAEAKAQAKATAEGKLAALGLTTDDLRALGL